MKIGIDCRVLSCPPCGIRRYLENLLRALSQIDRENRYLLFSRDEFVSPLEKEENFRKVVCAGRSTLRWEQGVLPAALGAEGVDVFHCPRNYGVPWRKKWRVVLTVHDLIPRIFAEFWRRRPWKQRLIYEWSTALSVRRSDHIMTDSDNTRRDLTRCFCVEQKPLTVVFPGVGREFYPEESPQPGLRDRWGIEGSYVLHLGGIGFNKNTQRVIGAVERLRRRDPCMPQLVIAGGKTQSGDEGGIRRIGFVGNEDLRLLYSGSRALLYPSLYEGFGLPLLEAMSCGVPVITARTSSLPEVAADAALYADPLDAGDIADNLSMVLHDEALRARLVRAGLERARQFSWERTARSVLEVYRMSAG